MGEQDAGLGESKEAGVRWRGKKKRRKGRSSSRVSGEKERTREH